MQQALFENLEHDILSIQTSVKFDNTVNLENQVPDLIYQENYLNQIEEYELIQWLDNNDWLSDLKRRVQHYGYKYDYKARKINQEMYIGQLPNKLQNLAERIYRDGLVEYLPDQVIINEYYPGQGISNHVDCETCFESDIVTISLNSGCVMAFTQAQKTNNKLDKKTIKIPKNVIPVWLHPRSIAILKGEARWWWFHGIAARKSDKWKGVSYPRDRRISLTFRKIKKN